MTYSVIPSPATKALAERIINDARNSTGFDAVIDHMPDLNPRQTYALVALLAEAASRRRGKTSLAAEKRARGEARRARIEREDAAYTEEQARRAHAQWSGGIRSEWARVGSRVYQRRKKRGYRQAAA